MLQTAARSHRGPLLGAVVAVVLSACAAPRVSEPSAPASAHVADEVVAYPAGGQGARQTRRDRYECHLWAVQQSGYDPALAPAVPSASPRVVADPPAGISTVTGAVAGAVIGAAVANRHHAGDGAAVGAVVGAVAGAGADASRQARADEIQARYDARAARNDAAVEQQADGYRRALAACLDARGYRVR